MKEAFSIAQFAAVNRAKVPVEWVLRIGHAGGCSQPLYALVEEWGVEEW